MTIDIAAVRSRLADPVDVASRLGLLEGSKRSSQGLVIRCPAHRERNASCSLHVGDDGTLACRCFSCGWSADAIGLVGMVLGLDVGAAIRAAGEIAGVAPSSGRLPQGRRRPSPYERIRARVNEEAERWLRGQSVRLTTDEEQRLVGMSAAAHRAMAVELVEADEAARREQEFVEAELERLADAHDALAPERERRLARCPF